jgi:hypothetical protein
VTGESKTKRYRRKKKKQTPFLTNTRWVRTRAARARQNAKKTQKMSGQRR